MIKTVTHFKGTLTAEEIDFRRMCDNSPIFIWMSNASGACFFFNKAWRKFTGQKETEILREAFVDRIHPDERELVSTRFNKHFASRTPCRVEYRLLRHDGVYRWVISHASPYYDSKNNFAGFVSVMFDFNEQHEFENTLATRALKQSALASYGRFALESHKFAELTHEAVNLVLLTLSVDCAYIAALNQNTLALTLEASACRLGSPPPRDLGTVKPGVFAISRAMQMVDDPGNFPLAEMLAANGIHSALMCPIGSGNQLYGYIFANTRADRTFSPEATDFLQGLANILATVHERERVEKALAESEQRLLQSQKIEAIGLLAGGVAHDFNNLITAIRGYTELLQKDIAQPPSPAATRALRAHTAGIENASLRASKLVRQLLAFSRTQVPEAERIDINALILNLKDLIAAFLRSGIHLELQLGPEPVNAHVDRNQIEQVIINLAINSRDAMPDGGHLTINVSPVRVTPATHPALEPGDYAQISVTDTGTGISPEVQPKLFAPFFTTKPKNHGTGLGLPTCANIVKNARGKITFDTEPGKGTTFTVLLPDFPAPQAATHADSLLTPFILEHGNPSANPASDDPLPPPGETELPTGTETIILVEDDPAIRDVTTAILESLGYTVCAYETGESLIAQYAAGASTLRDARLLVTDINMPGINGRQLADRMNSLHRNRTMRVLFISGFISEALQKSGVHFLEKPFTRDILARKVREALDSQSI